MEHPAIAELVCGGYFITRAVPRPEFVDHRLLPALLFSLSSCIVPSFPDDWALAWTSMDDEERITAAGAFGITPAVLPELTDWVTRAMDVGQLGWPNVFSSVAAAREMVARFVPDASDLVVLGIGLQRGFVGELLHDAENLADQSSGICDALQHGEHLAPGGEALGYEVLGHEYGSFHSWLCNGLERDVWAQLGIRPGPTGFIESAVDGVKAAAFCNREDVGSEPVLWEPWLIVRYV